MIKFTGRQVGCTCSFDCVLTTFAPVVPHLPGGHTMLRLLSIFGTCAFFLSTAKPLDSYAQPCYHTPNISLRSSDAPCGCPVRWCVSSGKSGHPQGASLLIRRRGGNAMYFNLAHFNLINWFFTDPCTATNCVLGTSTSPVTPPDPFHF